MNTGINARVIAVDAMGADAGPNEVVAAVKLAVKNLEGLGRIVLVGQQEVLKPLLEQQKILNHPKVALHHASEVIGMDEKPIQSLKQKKDSSMLQAIELMKRGEAQVVLSAGNTGSLMAAGTIKVRPLQGIERPALATIWPSKKNHFLLLDAGANPDARAEHLFHNAILGSNYAKIALKIESPRIGLLTIGTEEGKGNTLVTETHELLKSVDGLINYSGLIEGFQLFNDQVDVVVCDGFVGNILLKTCEAVFHLLGGFLKDELSKNPLRQLGGLISMPAFRAMKKQLSPEKYGGAPLLGLKGHVLKAHGSSKKEALMHAMRIGLELIENDMNDQILQDIKQANAIIEKAN